MGILQYRDFLAQPIPTRGPRWNPERKRPIRAAASDLIPGAQRVSSCMKTPIPGGLGLHMCKIVIQSMRICSIRGGEIFLNQDKKYM